MPTNRELMAAILAAIDLAERSEAQRHSPLFAATAILDELHDWAMRAIDTLDLDGDVNERP